MDHTQYFKHLLGLTGLMAWLKRWERFEGSPVFEGNELHLGPIASQRIGFGVPRSARYGKTPFLAFQKEERQWVELMPWTRGFVVPSRSLLVLVASSAVGDHEQLSDLPAFALAIPFDQPEKIAILNKAEKICFRGLWFEEDSESHLSVACLESGPAWQTLNLESKEEGEEWLTIQEKSKGLSFDEMLMQKIQNSNREINPGYLGNATPVSQQFKNLVDTFDPSKIKKVTDSQGGV